MRAGEPDRPAKSSEPAKGDAPAEAVPPSATNRCKRCRKPITSAEYERFFERTGLCFWCAYVDPQG
jgi:hypothetical protein